MKVLIVEDEAPAAKRLQTLLNEVPFPLEVIEVTDSIESTLAFLSHYDPELIFMDIQLADGISFEIFEKQEIRIPIIFTTAYDQYAIQAFKVNSIDYLLKPIIKESLIFALEKLQKWSLKPQAANLEKLLNELTKEKKYKSRFLLKLGDHFTYIHEQEIAYFLAESKLTWVVTKAGRQLPIDQNLEDLEQQLDTNIFFRVNRKFIVRIDAISNIRAHVNSRLRITLQPKSQHDVIISRERAPMFKDWLDS